MQSFSLDEKFSSTGVRIVPPLRGVQYASTAGNTNRMIMKPTAHKLPTPFHGDFQESRSRSQSSRKVLTIYILFCSSVRRTVECDGPKQYPCYARSQQTSQKISFREKMDHFSWVFFPFSRTPLCHCQQHANVYFRNVLRLIPPRCAEAVDWMKMRSAHMSDVGVS